MCTNVRHCLKLKQQQQQKKNTNGSTVTTDHEVELIYDRAAEVSCGKM